MVAKAEVRLHQIGRHDYAAPEVIPHIYRKVPTSKVAESKDVALRKPTVVDEPGQPAAKDILPEEETSRPMLDAIKT
jgi:hypothetical protein